MGTHIYVYRKDGKERVDLPWPKLPGRYGPQVGERARRLERMEALLKLDEILIDPFVQALYVRDEDWLVEALADLELAVLADDFGFMQIA